MRRAVILAALVVTTWTTVRSQTPDPNSQIPRNTIRGQVLAADGGAPIANARILHNFRPLSWTDASGRFEVAVARDSSPLQVEKAGFLRQTVDAGSQEPVVRMPRSATLSIHVVDDKGKPVPWRSFRVSGPAGGILWHVDDRGQARLTGLTPGRYAADLEDLAPPSASTRSELEDELDRRDEARAETRAARRSGPDLHGGGEERIVLTMPSATALGQARNATAVRGRVSGADDGPVVGARVWLKGQASEAAAETDITGAYAFEGVLPGTYRVYVAATGRVFRQFGQDALGIPGREVVLKAGQQLERIDVRLPRGGVVTGRVTDRRGEPYAQLGVVLVERVRQQGSEKQDLLGAGSDVTDSDGRFRISGVEPGTYYLVARPRTRSEPPLFHPAALSIADATRLMIRDGEELANMDMAIDWDRGSSVSGVILDPDGKPMRSGTMTLERAAWVTDPVFARTVPIGKDGAFSFLGVSPGEYALWLGPRLTLRVSVQFGGSGIPSRPRLRVPTGGATLVVRPDAPVSVQVRTSLAPTLSGRLVAEGGGTVASPQAFELVAERGRARAIVREDGTFDVPSVTGTTRFALAAAPRGWWLKSLMIGTVNAADTPFAFVDGADSRHGMAALIARTGGVSGRLLDANGQPGAQAPVVIFPVDRDRWYEGSRYVRSARADAAGAFVVEAPPGDYFIAATAGRPDVGDKALAKLAPGATRVTVEAGETVTQDVRAR